MGKSRRAAALLVALAWGTLALSGCTDAAPAPTQAPTTAAGNYDAIIFESQRSMLKHLPAKGTVLRQYTGTGPATIDIGPLASGDKQLGVTVICDGAGGWETRIVENGDGWAGSGCDIVSGTLASFPVATPAMPSNVKITVAGDAHAWVTFYSTK